jgi:DNA-directed RNA polymerase III subunit RPC6
MATAGPVSDQCEALYARCKEVVSDCEDGFTKIFTQTELLDLCDSEPLDTINTGHGLLPLVTELSANKLFITLKSKGGSTWSIRRREIAKLLRTLTRDEYMVYEIIEEAYESGIWIKNIKKRSGINDGKSMEKLVAKLTRTSLIKTVKNVKAPAQKTYMLYHLAPSDDVTGGSFYDAGDLDENLVDTLSNVIVFHVRMFSWAERRKKHIKAEKSMSPELTRSDGDLAKFNQEDVKANKKKRKRDAPTTSVQTIDIEDLILPRKHRSHKHTHDPETEPDANGSAWLLHPTGHEYPTAASVHQFIVSGTFLHNAKASTVSIEEIQNIINVLIWDGKLEEVNGGYRTVRGVQPVNPNQKKPVDDDTDDYPKEDWKRGNGLTEMPCGRCPVVDLCAPGGLISAATCVYFDEWLNEGAASA